MSTSAPAVQPKTPDARWLVRSCVVGAALGAGFVLFPGLTQRAFGVMVYGQAGFPPQFGAAELAYIRLAHAVIGALIAGFFTLMAWHARVSLPRAPDAWRALLCALAVWFVLDTGYSLASGFWPNAVLNLGVLLALAPALWRASPARARIGPR